MNISKLLGILFIILGLIFVIFPLFSAGAVSIIAGISLITYGIVDIINGFTLMSKMPHITILEVLLGICSIMLGIMFIQSISALSFIVGFQFYIIAFVLIISGIAGLFSTSAQISKIGSVLILILGIITISLAAFSIAQPLFVAILVGVSLLIEGIKLLLLPPIYENRAIEQ